MQRFIAGVRTSAIQLQYKKKNLVLQLCNCNTRKILVLQLYCTCADRFSSCRAAEHIGQQRVAMMIDVSCQCLLPHSTSYEPVLSLLETFFSTSSLDDFFFVFLRLVFTAMPVVDKRRRISAKRNLRSAATSCSSVEPALFKNFSFDVVPINVKQPPFVEYIAGKDEWPSNSPDVNPLDYHVWRVICLNTTRHFNPSQRTLMD